jgi:hypothetical protein
VDAAEEGGGRMTVRPVAHYLARFDDATAPQLFGDTLEFAGLSPLVPQASPEDDTEARIAEAREEGRSEGEQSAREAAAVEAEQMRQEAEAHLAAERQSWVEQEAEVLKEQLAAAVRQMEDDLAEGVGRILRPFLVEALRRQMVSEMLEELRSMVASREAIEVKISGPADLLAMLKDKLGPLGVAIAYEENEGVDLRVASDPTTIETRLQAWIDLINANME